MDGRYIAFLGGTETYGRFIEIPFPTLIEQKIGLACVNFGVANAGVDLYLNDPAVLEILSGAEAKVVQVAGAQNLSNRFYSVHPRRNDRFLRASDRLQGLYPEVDFTEFHFVRHMLGRLSDVSRNRFHEVTDELRMAWVARMKHLLTQIRGKVVLLWFADHAVPLEMLATLDGDPLFVNREMIETLQPRVSEVIEVAASDAALIDGTKGMVFSDFEACAASELLGPRAHDEVAEALAPVLESMLGLPEA